MILMHRAVVVHLLMCLFAIASVTSTSSNSGGSDLEESSDVFHAQQKQQQQPRLLQRRRINSKNNVIQTVNNLARSTLLRKVGPHDDITDDLDQDDDHWWGPITSMSMSYGPTSNPSLNPTMNQPTLTPGPVIAQPTFASGPQPIISTAPVAFTFTPSVGGTPATSQPHAATVSAHPTVTPHTL